MKIRGIELEINTLDASVLRQMNERIQRLGKDIQEQTAGKMTLEQQITAMCCAVRSCIDEIFGAGTADIILKESEDFEEHVDVLIEIADNVTANSEQRMAAIAGKVQAWSDRKSSGES